MDEITVREASVDDATTIARIHVRTWQCAYNGQIPDDYLSSLDIEKRTEVWNERLGNEIPAQTRHLVAEIGGKVVGFCDVGPYRGRDVADNSGELYAMYVDSTLLGHGIGSLLMRESISSLKKFKFTRAYLWVLKTNAQTIHFYEKHDWKADNVEKTEVENGVLFHELRMAHLLH